MSEIADQLRDLIMSRVIVREHDFDTQITSFRLARYNELSFVERSTLMSHGAVSTNPTNVLQAAYANARTSDNFDDTVRVVALSEFIGKMEDHMDLPVNGYIAEFSMNDLAELMGNTVQCRITESLMEKPKSVQHLLIQCFFKAWKDYATEEFPAGMRRQFTAQLPLQWAVAEALKTVHLGTIGNENDIQCTPATIVEAAYKRVASMVADKLKSQREREESEQQRQVAMSQYQAMSQQIQPYQGMYTAVGGMHNTSYTTPYPGTTTNVTTTVSSSNPFPTNVVKALYQKILGQSDYKDDSLVP